MATITGTSLADRLDGTANGDDIYGLENADWLIGYQGIDTLYGGAGYDTLNGGYGDDYLYGEDGDDVFEIGGSHTGTDSFGQLAGGLRGGWDTFDGGAGYDTIKILPTSGFSWTAVLIESLTGVEAIVNDSGGPGKIYFKGTLDLSGLVVMNGINNIYGTAGDERFIGSKFNETVEGGSGNDILDGNGGDDSLAGGLGNDTLNGGTGADTFFVYDNEGWDTYRGGTASAADTASNDTLIVQQRTGESLTTIEVNIAGWSDINVVENQSGANLVLNFAGSFNLASTQLKDVLGARGGAGNDTIVGNISSDSSLSANRGIVLEGGGGNDTISGSSLRDAIKGGTGNDVLLGAGGNDQLTGGAGVDYFWFEKGHGSDSITDFTDGVDRIVVGASVSTVQLYNASGSALLQLDDTYVLLSGVAPSAITGADLLWA